MNTILIDNHDIRETFYQMLYSQPQDNYFTRVLCLSAQSGKGKSTFINYFEEYCQEHNAVPVRLDFETFFVSSVLELIKAIIDEFGNFQMCHDMFLNYNAAIEKLAMSKVGDTVIQNVNLVQTHIGAIHIQKATHEFEVQLHFIETAFFKDIKNIVTRFDGKIVFLLDAFERAPKNVQAWVQKKLIASKLLGRQIVIVIAGQQAMNLPANVENIYGVKQFRLPDAYQLEDWVEYGQKMHILNIDTIRKCYACWKGEPFRMCISLQPFASSEESQDGAHK